MHDRVVRNLGPAHEEVCGLQEEVPQHCERQPVRVASHAAALQLLTDQRPTLDQLILVQPVGPEGKLQTRHTPRCEQVTPPERRPVTRSLPIGVSRLAGVCSPQGSSEEYKCRCLTLPGRSR